MRLTPTTEAEVADAMRNAIAARLPLVVEGNGTRRGLARPVQAATTLSLEKLSGITLYEPSEMVIGAWAGTPLSEINRTLDAKGQMLAFEPMDHRALYGSTGEPTIGAIAAGNISGPRRVSAGACRDSLIGVRFVNGKGETVKNGGRVMKNVTGLDLVKLQCGALGTLGILTEVIFKVIPKPATIATLDLRGLTDTDGIAALCAAMNSPFEPTGAAHIPADLAGGTARTLLRIEGFPEQIAYRSGALAKLLKPHGQLSAITDDGSKLWQDIRDAAVLATPATDAIWRISVPPTKAVDTVAAIRKSRKLRCYFDWSGGLIWLATPEEHSAGHDIIQSVTATAGGHATLVRGSETLRASIPVMQPLEPAVMQLQRGLKASFDPDGLINPGRMYAGI
jgi:glycolate oxidase FAD binding subunit